MTTNNTVLGRVAILAARTSLLAAISLAPMTSAAFADCNCGKDKEVAQTAPALAVEDIVVGDLTIAQPWSRATAKGAHVAGGYVVLTNKGTKDDVLLSGSTNISDKVEIHEMAVTDGVMRMRNLAGGLPIKAGESVELKPGSYHVMFIGLKNPLMEGETFVVDMNFQNAGKVPVKFTVRGIGARGTGHEEKHGSAKHKESTQAN